MQLSLKTYAKNVVTMLNVTFSPLFLVLYINSPLFMTIQRYLSSVLKA